MVPWTPRHHREGPSIASLQRDIGKGGISCCFVKISSKTPKFTSIETKVKQQDRSLPAPRPTDGLQHPWAHSESYRSRFWAVEIDHLLHENFGQWDDFPAGWEPSTLTGFLWSSASGWEMNWHIRCPSLSALLPVRLLLLLSEMEVLKQCSQDIWLGKACPSFPRPKRLGNPDSILQLHRNKYQSMVYTLYEQVSSSIVNICETYYK